MVTRSELRAQQQAAQEKQDEQSSPAPVKQHHKGFILGGVIVLTLLFVSLLMNMTVLNSRFVIHEATNSVIEDNLVSQVNGGLEKYGISSSVLTKKDTNKLIKQAVNQVYAGKRIKLDLTPVVKHVGTSASNELSQYGIEVNIPSQVTGGVAAELNAEVNSQVNTPAVTTFIDDLKVAKTACNLVEVISGLILLVLVGWSLIDHHLWQSFSWIGLWTLVVGTVLVQISRQLVLQAAQDEPDYTSLIAQVMNDFTGRADALLGLLLLITVILFVGRFAGRLWRR